MTLQRQLVEAVGSAHLLTDPGVALGYGTDWTGRWSARPLAVVRPGGVDQVGEVLQACSAAGVGVVVQGGNTGLVGGSVPRRDDAQVLLSTRRLRRLDPVDPATGTVVAGAGITLAAVQAAARAAGLRYAVDLGARDSATVGGTVATNAAGLRALGLGDTRAQLRGVRAVLADGSLIDDLDRPSAGRGGYDLAGLLCGSEGTLAVLTDVRLRLMPRPTQPPTTVLVGLPSVSSALPLLAQRGLVAAELVLRPGLELVGRVTGLPDPLADVHPAYLLLEVEGEPDLSIDAAAVVGDRLWAYRERLPEAIATLGVPHKLDVALPVGAVPAFLDELPSATERHETHVFGHLGRGDLHVNLLGLAAHDDDADDRVLRLVLAHGGSVAAEHGVGVAKTRWFTPTSAQQAVKRGFDPEGLLNPGVLFG